MLYTIIHYTSILSSIPSAVISVFYYKKLHNRSLRILAAFVFYSVIFELIMYVSNHLRYNNAYLSGIHSIGELLLIVHYLSSNFKARVYRYWYKIGALLLSACMLLELSIYQNEFPIVSRTLHSTYISIIAIVQIFTSLRPPIITLSEMLVLVGLFLYFANCSVIFALSGKQDDPLVLSLWILHDVFNLVLSLSICTALLNYVNKHEKIFRAK